jgi:hypothetical protein
MPFGLLCVSLIVCWYATHSQPTADLAAGRARAPWYRRVDGTKPVLTAHHQ